jgi:DNA polymerase III epsilon subunit-like protein
MEFDILEREVALYDLESTGLGFSAGIVEIAVARFPLGMLLDPKKELPVINSYLVNPGCEIEPEAYKVHGISEDDVMFEPKLDVLWEQSLRDMFNGAYYVAGYNNKRYDDNLLNANLKRSFTDIDDADLINHPSIDVYQIYQRLTGNRKGKLSEVAKMYGVEHKEQHRAKGDVAATLGILKAMLLSHGVEAVLDITQGPEIPDNVMEIAKLYRESKLKIEELNKVLTEAKKSLSTFMEDEDELVTPYLTCSMSPGRKTVDYKRLLSDLELGEDELAKYTKISKPSMTVRLA